ncbi:hypothetical protein JL101_032275 (plasmid) [Skermanella rosea]|uniref:RNase A-like domain-containing protein n=1 Tax=Skermanella rosea TaxID=1817965 RepID=UPI0019312611|nr:RNase A-like domain-containing protein [Skermanella rosea]UEM07596.1 hypothetical protein JL101_032275 [Skermanella rosea]
MPQSTTFKNKDAKRVLDKSEGAPSHHGAPMHSRERHADKSDAELIARFNNNFRVGTKFSTFKSSGDQNEALSAYFKTSSGKRDLERIKSSKKKERISLANVSVGSSSITVRIAEGTMGVQGAYAECRNGKLRSLTAVIETDGKGGYKIVTCYPVDAF